LSSIAIPSGSLEPRVVDLGLLLGVLTGTSSNLSLDLDWFENPLPALENIPQDAPHLLQLLRDFLGKTAAGTPSDREWYALNYAADDGETVASGVYLVLPLASDTTAPAIVGVGLWREFTASDAAYPIAGWVYLPVFAIPLSSSVVVTGTSGHPVEIRLDITKSSGTFSAGGSTFTGFEFASDVYFADTAPSFSLTFLDLTPASSINPVTNLDGLKNASVADWVNLVLGTDKVAAWLGTEIPSTSTTIGDVLVDLELLVKNNGLYVLGDFSAFTGKSPAQVAELLLSEALKVLASDTNPIVKLGDGGVYVVSAEASDKSYTDYGLRLQVPDIDVSPADKNKPRLKLQIGKWLTGDTDKSNWYTRSDATDAPGDLGITVLLVRIASPSNAISFVPQVSLVSLGFDFDGANGNALVDVKGVKLGGIEPRFSLSVDTADTSTIPWAIGGRADRLALPVGNGLSGAAAKNPVAQNLLSSGDDQNAGDKEPIDPAFSVAISKVVVPSGELSVQLYGPDDALTDRVWIPVQRAFGPLGLQRLGVDWPQPPDPDDPKLTFLFDARVMLTILEIDLIGLAVGIPLKQPGTIGAYDFGLDGLAIAYESGPLSINAGLVKEYVEVKGFKDKILEYNGAAVVKAAKWSLGAIGSYASIGAPSLFIFGQFNAPIGGPAFFFVTGLCAGFGYNRNIRIPGQDEVPEFPLLSGVADPGKIGGKDASPADALKAMGDWIQPAQGFNWFAAGVQFTSFELIQSNVVLVVVPTGDFELAILGISRLKLPQQGTTQYAYVELGIAIDLKPSAGFFSVTAVISPNSYVIVPDCHLSGGFAFYLWFAKDQATGVDHSGDFVVTIGGYHPAFQKPDWYPAVPRLGFSWQVNDNVSIGGDAYFALTPSCVMGGGSLDVQFHAGDLRAWFTAHADFLFHWKPFYFQGSVGISIGASYRVNLLFCSFTVSVELGAELEIWGPPTGGKVHVDWYVISFTIPFGSDPAGGSGYIPWNDPGSGGFKALLPQNDAAKNAHPALRTMALEADLGADEEIPLVNVCTTSITGGLISLEPDDDPAVVDGKLWLVRANGLVFSVDTAFPLTEADSASSANVLSKPATTDPSYYVGVKPMGINKVDSVMTITVTGPGETIVNDLTTWAYAATMKDVPEALWGTPPPLVDGKVPAPSLPANSADVLLNRLVGIGGIAPQPQPLTGPPKFPLENLDYVPINKLDANYLPFSDEKPVDRQPAEGSLQSIADTVAAAPVITTRGLFFAALADAGIDAGANGSTAELAALVNFSYPDTPMAGAPWGVHA
jgi:hypothetical protein